MSEAFYVDQFLHHKQSAIAALRSDDGAEARYHLLKAAEFLVKLAQCSTGEIRAARLARARDLMARAARIPWRSGRPPVKEPAGTEEGEPDSSRWRIRERPTTRFDDIFGLDDVKEQIRLKMIYPFTHPEKAKRYGVERGGGILLYGPPGTGKTMLGRAVAAELASPFYLIKPSDMLSQWVGESEKNIAALFQEARSHDRAILFLDEVDALVPSRREMQSGVMQRVVPQILAELDGFQKGKGALLFLAATNEPWEIDPAMLRPGRLDEKIYVGLPDARARLGILQAGLRGAPLAPGLDLPALAGRLEGFSGADLTYLARKVRELVFRESVERSVDRSIELRDFEELLRSFVPSVRPTDLERFEQFQRELR